MKTDFKKFFIIWLVVFVALEITMNLFGFGKPKEEVKVTEKGVIIELTDDKFSIGKAVNGQIINNTDTPIVLSECVSISESECAPTPILSVMTHKSGKWEAVTVTKESVLKEGTSEITIQPTETYNFSLAKWGYDFFNEIGTYKLSLLHEGSEYTTKDFSIAKQGIFKRGWNFLIHKPIYNTLIYFIELNPTHSLGIAIILLTLLVRLILLAPSQKALKAQKRMQEIQPRIKQIQEKYKGNQEKIAMETMLIWKDAKVNPLGSCLPILLQFPILIGLYYTVKEVVEGGNKHMLYSFLQNFDFSSVHTQFLSMNLAEKNLIILPLCVGLLQFFQMKLTFKNRGSTANKEPKKQDGMPDMESMNKIMTYTLPLMIMFFTATLPAGVGVYWGTSTLFGIIQTYFVNNQKETSNKTSEVVVKVIEPSEKEKIKKYLPKGQRKNN